MMQAVISRLVKLSPWIALGLAVALVQGGAVFAFWGSKGSFLSLSGLKCILVPLGVEFVVAIVAAKSLDELHAQAVANPHSLLGHSLRNDPARPSTAAPSAPPPTREAWKGGFEPMDDAPHSMSRKDH